MACMRCIVMHAMHRSNAIHRWGKSSPLDRWSRCTTSDHASSTDARCSSRCADDRAHAVAIDARLRVMAFVRTCLGATVEEPRGHGARCARALLHGIELSRGRRPLVPSSRQHISTLRPTASGTAQRPKCFAPQAVAADCTSCGRHRAYPDGGPVAARPPSRGNAAPSPAARPSTTCPPTAASSRP